MDIKIILNRLNVNELIEIKREVDNVLKTLKLENVIAIKDLNVSNRCLNACKVLNLTYLHEVASLARWEFKSGRQVGLRSLVEIEDLMHKNGYKWKDEA